MSTTRSKTGIIIPTYNHVQFVCEAIDSALKQTANCVVIVVDDGSTDDTQQALKVFGDKITILTQRNRGLSTARNAGVQHGLRNPEIGSFLPVDADDRIQSTMVEACLDRQRETGKPIIYPDIHFFGDTDHIYRAPQYDLERLKKENQMIATCLFTRGVYEAILEHNRFGYDPYISHLGGYEDWLFWLEAGVLGLEGAPLGQALVDVRKHGVSMLTLANRNRQAILDYMRWKMQWLYNVKVHF